MAISGGGAKSVPVVVSVNANDWTKVANENPSRRAISFQNQGAVSVVFRGPGSTGAAPLIGETDGTNVASGGSIADTASRDAWYARSASSTANILRQEVL